MNAWNDSTLSQTQHNTTNAQSWYSALPISLVFLGLLLASIGSFSCSLFKADWSRHVLTDEWGYTDHNDYQMPLLGHMDWNGDGDSEYIGEYDPYNDHGSYNGGRYPSSLNFGYGSCLHGRDAPLKAGYAFSIVATIFGVFTLIAVILTTIMTFSKKVFWGMATSTFVIALCVLLALSVGFATDVCNNDVKCTPGPAWYAGLVGLLCWIGAGVSLLFMMKYEQTEVAVAEGTKVAVAEATEMAVPDSTEAAIVDEAVAEGTKVAAGGTEAAVEEGTKVAVADDSV
jgi:lysylphosphatidylglycerol synthetase-like protein (DUF2156 family)